MSREEFHRRYSQLEELKGVELIEGVVYMPSPFSHRNAPFENGDVMSREEFHRRYSECEGLERVELIEGVVYMPSPIKVQGHAREQKLMIVWLAAYEALHEESVEATGPASLLLEGENEPEPDAMLYRLREDRFQNDYVKGAPELVVEIARSSMTRDMYLKKAVYERNGVREYIVWRTGENAIDWFQLRDGVYVLREPGPDGIIESEEFPGLRLDVPAMLEHDRKKVLAAVG